MSFFCYHFPFGETQKAWHREIYKRRTCKLQKKKQKEITEEKIYKRKNFTEEEKTQKRNIFKPTKDKAKADFYKRQKATQNFLYKRESEADFLQKRNWKKKRKTEG